MTLKDSHFAFKRQSIAKHKMRIISRLIQNLSKKIKNNVLSVGGSGTAISKAVPAISKF